MTPVISVTEVDEGLPGRQDNRWAGMERVAMTTR